MRRRVAVVLAILTAAFCIVCVRTYGFPGQTMNGGVYLPMLHAGVEVWGHPGPFTCPEGC